MQGVFYKNVQTKNGAVVIRFFHEKGVAAEPFTNSVREGDKETVPEGMSPFLPEEQKTSGTCARRGQTYLMDGGGYA